MSEFKKYTIWSYLFTQVLMFMLIISLFAAVSGFEDGTSDGYRFRPGWSGFWLMVFSIFSMLVLFRMPTSYLYGAFVCGYAFTVIYVLDIIVYFGTIRDDYKDADRDIPQSFTAVVAIGALYFIFSMFVAVALHLFNGDMIADDQSKHNMGGASGEAEKPYDMRHVSETDV